MKITTAFRSIRSFALTILPLAFALAAHGQSSVAELKSGFRNPPDDARIMMRWWWFGPAVTKPELAREMRFMKEGGIGGFEVQPVYPVVFDDAERGIRNLPYMSEDFLDALRFTADEAKRLGLRFDLTLGSGWPYGGPHVKIAQSSGRLRVDRVAVPADSRRVTLPDLRAGEKLLAAFAVRAEEIESSANGERSRRRRRVDYRVDPSSPRRLKNFHDGALWLPADVGQDQQVWFFISSRTGKLVERSALDADGFIIDHYRRDALDVHLKAVGEPLLEALGPHRLPYAIFCDSLEADSSDWTPDFLAEFQKRRGYDLTPHLPALAADAGPSTRAIRRDWGKTLTELLNEQFLQPLQQWSHEHNTRLRIQDYGVPPAAIASNAYADLPEGEGSHWKSLTPARWASSASHMYGRPMTSSETWTWLDSPVFRATPLDMKAEADRHFLQGVNQLVGHGWPYTHEGIPYPGWHFYAAAVLDEKNPWYIVMPDVAAYLQRLSYLLRQGKPANDVALYLPNNDAWADMAMGSGNLVRMLASRVGDELIASIVDAGFGFDMFDDESLEQVGRIEGRSLYLGENAYRAVVLPAVETMPAETLRKLRQFASGGGVVIASTRRPLSAPGFRVADTEDDEVRQIARELFNGATARGKFVENAASVGSALAGVIPPDVTFSPAAPNVGFIHRKADGGEVYFVANTENQAAKTTASFRIGDSNLMPELWDPMGGSATPAKIVQRANGRVAVEFNFEPYGSRVIVFSRGAAQAPNKPGPLIERESIDISRDWKVRFGPDGEPVSFDRLRSWTEDESTRYFSGVAIYEKEANIPSNFMTGGAVTRLDFGNGTTVPREQMSFAGMRALLDGPIREAAIVYINGKRAGPIWAPPYWVEIGPLLKTGRNQIRIEVANLAINSKAGQPLPNYRLLNMRYGRRFTDQEMEKIKPQPAGILGEVRLVALRPN